VDDSSIWFVKGLNFDEITLEKGTVSRLVYEVLRDTTLAKKKRVTTSFDRKIYVLFFDGVCSYVSEKKEDVLNDLYKDFASKLTTRNATMKKATMPESLALSIILDSTSIFMMEADSSHDAPMIVKLPDKEVVQIVRDLLRMAGGTI